MSATCETDKRDVAADVSSAVEGWRPAARKEATDFFDDLQIADDFWLFGRFFRRAGRLGSTAGRMPAATRASAGASLRRNFRCLIDWVAENVASRNRQNLFHCQILFEHCHRPNHKHVPMFHPELDAVLVRATSAFADTVD